MRCLKQTPSVAYVFNSANHTRFEHSIGSMYIAEMYARNLNISDPEKELLRLCALLHDIGHCIFSHQYDATVYKEIYKGKHGHDIHGRKIIKKYLPDVLVETYNEEKLKKSITSSGLEKYLKSNIKQSIQLIMNDISEILKGEKRGEKTIYYNIIQGPLGCDRMDFIKRDSYFSGTGHYGGFPLDRLIFYSSIRKDANGNRILCYSSKILDDIIVFLINRFHMFINVYFRKACRALDLIFQQLLSHSMEPLDLVKRTSEFREFEKLNELNLFYEISDYYKKNFEKLKKRILRKNIYDDEKATEKRILDYLCGRIEIDEFYSEISIAFRDFKEENVKNLLKMLKKVLEAYQLTERILERNFYKTVIEDRVILTEELIRRTSPGEFLKTIAKEKKEELEKIYTEKEGDECPKLFIDIPYEIKMSPTGELTKSNIQIYDEIEKIPKNYRDIERERSFRTWNLESFNIYRIYTTSNTERNKLLPYAIKIMKKEGLEVDTSY
ncbi:MAG: HD domain-containing protein [Candidatus Methanofastidiosia archaeon]